MTTCPTCGSPVRVVSSDEGTSHYGPLDRYGWHSDGVLCLGPECGHIDEATGDHSTDVHPEEWWDGFVEHARRAATPPPLDAEIDRLRQQNHEAAERRDRDTAALQSQVDKYKIAYRRAKDRVRGTPVDWTNDPKASEPDGWWNHTSLSNQDILMAAAHDLAATPLADREASDTRRADAQATIDELARGALVRRAYAALREEGTDV